MIYAKDITFKLSRKKMGYNKEADIIILMLLTCYLAPVTNQQGKPDMRKIHNSYHLTKEIIHATQTQE